MIGIKIYEYEHDFNELVALWKTIGIDAAFVSKELAEDKSFRKLLKENNIGVYVIFPIFLDYERLDADPELYAITGSGVRAEDDWVKFICPSRKDFYNEKINEAREIVNKIKPDGISLDFIRYFVYWETVFPDRDPETIMQTCFDESCIKSFSAISGVSIPKEAKTISDKSKWIFSNCEEKWIDWKCGIISDAVKGLSETIKTNNPEIKVGIHAVPWRKNDFKSAIKRVAGQDFRELSKHVDYISPMCYSHMLKREPGWISSVVEDINNAASDTDIIPSIQVDKCYLKTEFDPKKFEAALIESLKGPSKSVVLWSWDSLAQSKEKMDICRKILNPGGAL